MTENSILKRIIFGEKKIRVFIFVDYEFLCSAYGITCANGMKSVKL